MKKVTSRDVTPLPRVTPPSAGSIHYRPLHKEMDRRGAGLRDRDHNLTLGLTRCISEAARPTRDDEARRRLDPPRPGRRERAPAVRSMDFIAVRTPEHGGARKQKCSVRIGPDKTVFAPQGGLSQVSKRPRGLRDRPGVNRRTGTGAGNLPGLPGSLSNQGHRHSQGSRRCGLAGRDGRRDRGAATAPDDEDHGEEDAAQRKYPTSHEPPPR